jgi:hypothetical protein
LRTISRFRSKKHLLVLALAGLFLVLFFPAPVLAHDPIRVEVTEVPYRPVHALLRVHFEFAGRQDIFRQEGQLAQKDFFIGFGAGLISARNSDVQFETNISYERFKADKLGFSGLNTVHELDLQLGGRYFPCYPTFRMGRIPVRLTFSALGGLGWYFPSSYSDVLDFSMILTAGLAVSSGDSASGFLVELIYRPLETNLAVETIEAGAFGALVMKPSFSIRIAWLFGPGD